jgi:hypothetical protein
MKDTLEKLDAQNSDYVIKLLKRNSDPTFHPCIFFAIDGKMNTYNAHDNLAITYYPRSCYKFDLQQSKFKMVDNRGNDISKVSNATLKNIPRCWPSFGQQGGAREIILVDDSGTVSLLPTCIIASFKDGGETDEFHQDNTTNYDIEMAKLIANIVASALRNNDINLEDPTDDDRGNVIGSFRSQSGVTINGKLANDKFISISSGFVIYGSSMRIKLWVSLWRDNEPTRKRCIYGPLERELTVSLFYCDAPFSDIHRDIKNIFKQCISLKLYPYSELRDIIIDLIRKATQVTDGFFIKKAGRYPLP